VVVYESQGGIWQITILFMGGVGIWEVQVLGRSWAGPGQDLVWLWSGCGLAVEVAPPVDLHMFAWASLRGICEVYVKGGAGAGAGTLVRAAGHAGGIRLQRAVPLVYREAKSGWWFGFAM